MGRLTIFFAFVVLCGALGVASASATAFSPWAAADATTLLPFPGSAGANIWMAVDDAHQHVFVSAGPGTSSIVVLDYAGNIVDTITGEPGASQMALDVSTHMLYVALHDATAISAIDTDTLTETSRFSTVPYSNPYNLVLAGGKLFFACAGGSGQNCSSSSGSGIVSVNLDGSGMTASIPGWSFATMLAAGGPGNDLLAAGNSYDEPPTLSVYDVTTDPPSLIKSVWDPGGDTAQIADMTFDPSGTNLLLASGAPYFIQSFSVASLTPSAEYPTGPYPTSTQTTTDGDFVAAGISANGYGPDLFVFPVGDTTPVGTWTLGANIAPHALAFSPDRMRLFAVSIDSQGLTLNVISNPAPDTPSVSVSNVDQSGSTAATLNGSVNAEGLATTYHFEYGTNTAYGTSTTVTSAGAGQTPVAVSAPISGLTPGTTYHYRLVATNSAGTSKTPDATFTAGAQSLTAITEGGGTGTITSAPAGVDCGSGGTACAAPFTTGSSVTLTATADSSSVFSGWGGDCSGEGSCTLTMSAGRSVKAFFTPLRTLTANKAGNGTGTITSSPAGIDCGSTCSASYAEGTSVTLTATAGVDSTFTGWSGACSGTGQCQVKMNANVTVFANFSGPDQMLTVTEAGSGSGTVTSAPAGINCGSVCSYQFVTGTSVTLTATAQPGSAFNGWSGTCTGLQKVCTLQMDTAHTVTASFIPTETLRVSKSGDGRGQVTSDPSGIKCGSQCASSYPQNSWVTLIATASRGSKFMGWSGACAGFGGCVVQLNTYESAIARFRAQCVVPDLVGLRLGTAHARLRAAHCSVGRVTRVFSSSIRKGRVISQRPRADAVRARGTKVNLSVSRG
jgi:hypothetical protein